MGSTCKQGKPNGNQKRHHIDIRHKTIQKAKAHPAERDRQWGMLTFKKEDLLPKNGPWWVNKLVFLIYYLSLFYLDLILFYLNIISF